ncbi:MAG: polysaccharide deacetylase family protein [Clostridia bacterium]|nr:polysaccharide deacetylase family protein [Clostridia bacterium]
MSNTPTVLDRTENKELTRGRRAKRVWFAILACVAVLALVASATFAVNFYLNLQEQQRLLNGQADSLAALQQTLNEQSEQIASQQEQLDAQESKLAEQESKIAEQESVIQQQQDTINKQKDTIKNQESTIDSLRPTEVVKGVATYPDIDVTRLKGKKLVALTFDDGPSTYTSKLLDALKKRGAKATFFVVGSRANSYASLIKRMEAEGHVVGNHSQNHKNLNYLSAAGVAAEMGDSAERIKSIIGHYPYIMRCPGGNYNQTVKNYAKAANMPIIQWSVDTADWKYRSKASVLSYAKRGIKDGSIVLMHDLYSTTVDAAIELIDYLQDQGYTLVTVPELLAAKCGTVEMGKVYFHG